jgi:LPS export ABC transporter protein LptC
MLAERRKAHLVRRLAAAGALLAAVPACEDLRPGPKVGPPAIELREVTLRQYDAGLSGVGQAADVSYLRNSGQLRGHRLLVDVPASEDLGRGALQVTAASGEADVGGQTVALAGGVRVTTGAGDEAESATARYAAADDVLRSEDPLRARGPGYEVQGERWEAHVHERRLELTRGAHLTVETRP